MSSQRTPPNLREILASRRAARQALLAHSETLVDPEPSLDPTPTIEVPLSASQGVSEYPMGTSDSVDLASQQMSRSPVDNAQDTSEIASFDKVAIARENLKRIQEEASGSQQDKKMPKGFSAPFRRGVRASAALTKTPSGLASLYRSGTPAPWDTLVAPERLRTARLRTSAKKRATRNVALERSETSIGLGPSSPKGPSGWPREIEAFCSAEMPSYPVPSFSDETHADRSSFLARVLRLAAHEGQEDVARAAVKLGAPLDAESSREGGPSLLGEVCSLGDLRATALLLALGANPNERSGAHAMTPLMWTALSSKPTQVARLLLKNGADIAARDNQGHNALIHALASEKRLYAEFLLEQSEIFGRQEAEESSHQESPLAMAAALGEEGTVIAQMLLQRGSLPHHGLHQNRSALEWSLVRGNVGLAQELLLAGACDGLGPEALEKIHGLIDEKPEFQALRPLLEKIESGSTQDV